MEIEVIADGGPEGRAEAGSVGAEEHRPLGSEALGGIVENVPLETIEESPNVKAKPKRSARPKAVRFEAARGGEASGREAQNTDSERGASSSAPEPKVKAKSRAKASARSSTEEAVEPKEPKEPEQPLTEEAEAIVGRWQKNAGPGRGRPPGARNKPKPPQIVERVVEKTVYERPPPLSPQDLQALLKDTLRKQELDAREQKRAYYSQLIRRNRF